MTSGQEDLANAASENSPAFLRSATQSKYCFLFKTILVPINGVMLDHYGSAVIVQGTAT